MRGSQNSRRVTWASDFDLCKVRLFLSDESPSQVGGGAQDHLQAKASWVSHLTGTGNDDVLPPGFELGQPSNQPQIKASDVPVITWRCPPRFLLNLEWQVVAGEESQDVEAQNQREIRVLEAVYPRPSAIPKNPALPGGMDSQHNDHRVPLIPITPVEDEEFSDVPNDSIGSMNSQPQSSAPGHPPQFGNISGNAAERMAGGGRPHGVEPDVLAAASAAFAAINRSNEQGSLIDHDLLVKILSNPSLIEKLVKDHGAASTIQNAIIQSAHCSDPLAPSSSPSQYYNGRTESNAPAYYGPANTAGQGVAGPNVQANPSAPFMNIPPPAVATGGQPVRDFSYYKSLIQQHGGERQDRYGQQQQQQQQRQPPLPPQDQLGYLKSKTKIMKPCMYFNSPRGCRNGANCAYQHDAAPQQRGSGISAEMQSSKRMKMDREISS